MFYKVLHALYPDHLHLFVAAVREALEVGAVDRHANLGAIFVESIKALAQEAGVDLGFTDNRSELAFASDDVRYPGELEAESPTSSEPSYDGWTAETLWAQALSDLQLQMPQATFDTWLRGTQGIAWNGKQLVVQLHSSRAQAWIENRMQATIERSVRNLVGHEVQVVYECRRFLTIRRGLRSLT